VHVEQRDQDNGAQIVDDRQGGQKNRQRYGDPVP
jgi:hypothetical protein